MEASPPHTGNGHNNDNNDPVIEGLRGVAALMVMAIHYGHMVSGDPGLWKFATTGVDLFFVLSGFVFAPYFFGRPLAMGPHLVRRAFRLLPLYWAALLLYVALRLPAADAWAHLGVHALLLHTWQSTDIAFFYNPAFWSLPPEAEFYLALPLLGWLSQRRAGWAWLAALAVALHVLPLLGAPPDAATSARWRQALPFHLPGVLVEFLAGVAAWKLSRGHGPAVWGALGRAGAGAAVLAALCILSGSPWLRSDDMAALWLRGNLSAGAALGYGLVVSALAGRFVRLPGSVRKLLEQLGALSFGIYLFHNAVPVLWGRWLASEGGTVGSLHMAGWPVFAGCVLATLVLAWVAHQVIEEPLRRQGRTLSRQWMARRRDALNMDRSA